VHPRALSAVADGYTICYKLSSANFISILGSISDVLKFEMLRKVPVLFNLRTEQYWTIAKALELVKF
jgi:hypothetical protein